MVMGSDEGSPEDLAQGDLDLGEQNGVINSSIPAEPVASSFAVALREKVMVARKESTSDILNLLSSSGPSPSASQHDGALRSPFAETPPGSGEMYSGENGTEGEVERLKVDSNVSAGNVTESGASMDNNAKQSVVNEQQTCVECEDQCAELFCLTCDEPYCRPCWGSLHRKGNRSQHVTRAIIGEVMPAPTTEPEPPAPLEHQPEVVDIPEQDNSDISDSQGEGLDSDDDDDGEGGDVGDEPVGDADSNDAREGTAAPDVKKRTGKRRSKKESSRRLAVGLHGSTVLEETRFIPLRLDERERGMLAMLKGALNVSEYTDRVDVYSRWSSKSRIMNNELRIALAALSGMMVTGEFNWGQKHMALLDTLDENQDAFADIFEVGRRYKITNPDKFRTFYGKMQFMLQDAQAQERSGLNLVKDIKMVYGFVKERDGLDMLEDDRVLVATADVSGRLGNKSEVQQLLVAKAAAREGLLKDYVSSSFSRQDVERVLDSIGDANNYIAFNVSPVERMLNLLKKNFHPDKPEGEWSLSLTSGIGGSRRKRISSYGSSYGSLSSYGYSGSYGSSMFGSSTAMLSHDHRTQYMFVSQSLRLWSEAMRSMYRLWYFADRDLVSGKASYRLCNTGQGLNRVQSCPSVSGEMRRILRTVQSECGPWVGLSVVHLGDRDVPNALVFIDKYTQIPRILGPIVDAVQSLEEMTCNPILEHYIEDGWGGVHNAKMAILSDFFKGGFDGSGDDGGSCIDGRLTSAWNWCSLMSKKPYAPIFYLAGQYGFDGGWGTGLSD